LWIIIHCKQNRSHIVMSLPFLIGMTSNKNYKMKNVKP
jgi:hypothetical protein